MSSIDGINWTLEAAPITYNYRAITYGETAGFIGVSEYGFGN